MSVFDDDTLGVDWTSVIGQIGGAGAQTGLALLFGPRPQGGGGPLKSQGEIAAALDAMWRDFHAVRVTLTPEQALQLSLETRAWLDGSTFDQGKASRVAYFVNTKNGLDTIIAQDRSRISSTSSSSTPPPSASPTAVNGNANTPSGGVQILGYELDGKILLVGAAAVAAVILLRE